MLYLIASMYMVKKPSFLFSILQEHKIELSEENFETYDFSHNFLGNFWRLVALTEEREPE